MEILTAFIIPPIIAITKTIIESVIALSIEYGIFQRRQKANETHSSQQAVAKKQNPFTNIASQNNDSFSPYLPYQYAALGFTGGIFGLFSTGIPIVIIAINSQEQKLDPFICCGLPWVLISVIGGALLSLIVDISFEMHKARLWQRIPLAIIMGIVSGWLSIILLVVGVFYYTKDITKDIKFDSES